MADRRPISLLDCAIAASAAVVPVLLGIFALVAWARPGSGEAAAGNEGGDRYVSVRQVAAMKTFERAITARTAATMPSIDATQVLDGVAACRREWQSAGGAVAALRRFVIGGAAEVAPAEVIAAQLGELDAALRRFSERANRRVEDRVGIDAARWFAAASLALATPIENDAAPGRPFRVRCADLAAALSALRRGDAALLETLAWRGSEGSAVLARWQPGQEVQISAQGATRRNPWGAVAGCVYLGGDGDGPAVATPRYFVAGMRSVQQRLCARPELSGGGDVPLAIAGEPGGGERADDPRWMVPPGLLGLLQPLRWPHGRSSVGLFADGDDNREGSDARDRTHTIRLDGARVDVGASVQLAIDPAMQALAQKTAACYTGRHDICRALGMHRREDGEGRLGGQLLEGAMVRMAAVAVIDVGTGRIEALAGALSPCARQEVDGPGRDAGCDARLPYPVRYRGDALLNPALFHDAMPASTIKPILAAAFLEAPGSGAALMAAEQAAMRRDAAPARDSLRGQLMRSDSARFLDRMFCVDRPHVPCAMPWAVQQAAAQFGWNDGCDAVRGPCGRVDVLYGRGAGLGERNGAAGTEPSTSLEAAYGRLLSEPLGQRAGAPMRLMPAATLDAGVLSRCAAGADGRRRSDDDWEKCRGGHVIDVVAEGWGQGHARASALGVAGMMATLATAANGATTVPRPHLIESSRGAALGAAGIGTEGAAPAEDAAPRLPALPRPAAEIILSGLSYSHRAGTARTACEQVLDAKRCRAIDWLAGKTGTPSFPGDGLSLDELAARCRTGPADVDGRCGTLRPYKWYTAAWRGDRSGQGPWTKTIAVLTERNWLVASGRIHGAGDTGPNPSAEIALQIVGRKAGLIEAAAP